MAEVVGLAERLWLDLRRDKSVSDLLIESEAVLPAYTKHILGESEDRARLKTALKMVALPGSIPIDILASRSGGGLLQRLGYAQTSQALTWAAAYRKDKRVYQIHPSVVEAVRDVPWVESYPTSALTLPSGAIVLDMGEDMPCLSVYLDLSTGKEHTGALELRVAKIFPSDGSTDPAFRVLTLGVFDLSGGTLGEAWALFEEKLAQTAGIEVAMPEETMSLVRLAINLLLFIQDGEDVSLAREPGKQRSPKDPTVARRLQDLREPSVYKVGDRFGRQMREWTHKGGTVRPHMRRAHPHLYWTGPGRQIPRVRFLLPIAVKGGPAQVDAKDTAGS